MRLPKKLKKDAIAEALCEVRFECDEVPELVVGKLGSHDAWRGYRTQRLPVADVPTSIRQTNPSLRHQPILEAQAPDGSRIVKIGSSVISYHVLAPYCGWEAFREELGSALNFVFSSLTSFKATRLGFRYINLLTTQDHQIASVTDLSLSISVAGKPFQPPFNLNYQSQRSSEHVALVRVASPEFVSGRVGRVLDALIDVDVSTPAGFETNDLALATDWIQRAHQFEKEEFFTLIPPVILEQLVESFDDDS
jgi:uncharacterized protein (TIGR04255 family)